MTCTVPSGMLNFAQRFKSVCTGNYFFKRFSIMTIAEPKPCKHRSLKLDRRVILLTILLLATPVLTLALRSIWLYFVTIGLGLGPSVNYHMVQQNLRTTKYQLETDSLPKAKASVTMQPMELEMIELKASVEQPVKCAFVKIEKNAFKVFKMNSYLAWFWLKSGCPVYQVQKNSLTSLCLG